jgi:hypothetical protein
VRTTHPVSVWDTTGTTIPLGEITAVASALVGGVVVVVATGATVVEGATVVSGGRP